ncbi:MAG: UDP-N-acetylmuramate dehydrogenase [Actinomycetota bacterium]|nr:UDP-N-acetylmuramate dehydrogenase [Actinomycetota bacterium]
MLLADLTTLRLGGPAARVVTATSTDALVDTVRSADAAGEPVLIVGGGSNLVVADAGWPGLVVLVRTSGIGCLNGAVTADAGVGWEELVAASVQERRSGLAAMSGIPGLTGATPVQNVGAYGAEVADLITALTVLDRSSGSVETWDPKRCGFGFRTSVFKHTDRYVVLDVTFALPRAEEAPPIRYAELARRLGIEPGRTAPSEQVREVVLDLRRSKGMLLDASDHDTWSVGSFFVNPFVSAAQVPDGCPNWTIDGAVKLSAAWLIENAGFGKGFGNDRVALSSKHTLALTNRGSATTEDLLALAREIRDGVQARFGIRLRPEAHLTGVTL